MEHSRPPISDKNMTRILALLCVILALVGGYYHAQRKTLQRRFDVVNTRYNVLLEKYESETGL